VRLGPARDRLDVWTFVRAGEEIACGDPSVSDAERAAAGRETLSERRAQEYMPGFNRARFAAHLRFVTDEVIPWAASRFGAAERSWVASGFSNGAVWAIAAAQRRPDVFAAVAAFSAGMALRQIRSEARTARVRHYLAAGTLEPGFREPTRQWAGRLQRAGLPCQHREWVGGHDQHWWNQQLPAALAFVLAPS
jgi:enterochelin esterase-like enzyme